MNPVIYSPDAIILPDFGVTRFKFREVKGPSAADNFPVNNPDGWVVAGDSPYFNAADEFGGQKVITKAYQDNLVEPYPLYDPSKPEWKVVPWLGKPWNKLNSYFKFLAHMRKVTPSVVSGWEILLDCEVNTTNEEYQNWESSRIKEGYDDSVAVEFIGNQISVNTKYTFNQFGEDNIGAGVGLRASGSDGTFGIELQLFIPFDKIVAFETFFAEFQIWQTKPKLKQTVDLPGLLEFIK